MAVLVTKILNAVFTAGLMKLVPASATIKGFLSVDQLERSILKALGFSSVPALLIGVLSWFGSHNGEFVQNSALAYALSSLIAIIVSALRKGYSGEDPSGRSASYAPVTLPASYAEFLAKTSNVPLVAAAVENPCPIATCPKFTGHIVEPITPPAL